MCSRALTGRSDGVAAALVAYNSAPSRDQEQRDAMLKEIAGRLGAEAFVETPFHCVVGKNLLFDANVYYNCGASFYDLLPIEVGPRSKTGPRARIYSGCSPDAAPAGLVGDETRPVRIGADCWVGSDVTLLSGSVVGDRVVIGAGSVVCGEIPSDCIAAGRPARVIRQLSPGTPDAATVAARAILRSRA